MDYVKIGKFAAPVITGLAAWLSTGRLAYGLGAAGFVLGLYGLETLKERQKDGLSRHKLGKTFDRYDKAERDGQMHWVPPRLRQ